MQKAIAAVVLTLALGATAQADCNCGHHHHHHVAPTQVVVSQPVYHVHVVRQPRTLLGRLWMMEKRKNAWLMRKFPSTIGRMKFLPTP